MTNYVEYVKPVGYDANLHKLGLFFPYNIIAWKNGEQYDFTVEVRDIEGVPDCKIGDFGHNVWFRTKPAMNKKWQGYNSYSSLSGAVKNSLIKRGFEVMGWYKNNF